MLCFALSFSGLFCFCVLSLLFAFAMSAGRKRAKRDVKRTREGRAAKASGVRAKRAADENMAADFPMATAGSPGRARLDGPGAGQPGRSLHILSSRSLGGSQVPFQATKLAPRLGHVVSHLAVMLPGDEHAKKLHSSPGGDLSPTPNDWLGKMVCPHFERVIAYRSCGT